MSFFCICELKVQYRPFLCFAQEIKQLVGCVDQLRVAVSELSSQPMPPQNPRPSGNGSPLKQSRALAGSGQQERNALNVLVPSNANASADIGYELAPKIKAAVFVKDFYELGLGRFLGNGECELATPKWRVTAPGPIGKPQRDARVEARKFMVLFRWVASESELARITAARSTNPAEIQRQLEDRTAAVDAAVQRIRDVYLPYLEGEPSSRTGDSITALYGRWKTVKYSLESPTASFSSSSSSAGILSWEQLQQKQQEEAAAAAAAAAATDATASQAGHEGKKRKSSKDKKRPRT